MARATLDFRRNSFRDEFVELEADGNMYNAQVLFKRELRIAFLRGVALVQKTVPTSLNRGGFNCYGLRPMFWHPKSPSLISHWLTMNNLNMVKGSSRVPQNTTTPPPLVGAQTFARVLCRPGIETLSPLPNAECVS